MRLILILLISSSLYSYGQERQTIIKVFSGYSTSPEESVGFNTRTTYDEKEFDLFRSISIAFQKQKRFHEIEVDKMKIQNEEFETISNGLITNGRETLTTSIKLRYSYNYILNYEAKMKVIVGVSTSPYFEKEFIEPLVGSFDRSNISFGAVIELIPKIQYQLSEKFLIECNMPIPVATLQLERQRNFDPSITIEQQKRSDSSVSFLDYPYQISLGIGYQF